jgi:hypothetical protein
MNKYLLIRLFLLLLISCTSAANALVVDNLYQADVVVPSQSKEDWQKALPAALDQVATKVSGSADIKITEQMRRSLPDISTLVQSYSYSSGTGSTLLHVQFDSHAIDNLLNRVGKPIWSNDRPLTLIWLATNMGQGQAILSNNPDDPTVMAAQSSATQRGLPILWPEMDLQDVTQIQTNDVLNFNAVAVQKASQRYHADNILVGKITQVTAGNWQGDWLYLSSKGQSVQWTTQGADSNKVIALAIDKLGASLMGQTVATAPSPTTVQPSVSNSGAQATLTLKIVNVDGLDDYADVMKYVRNLSSVVSVEASQVDADFVVLTVTVNGGQAALSRDIGLNQKLQPETSESPESSEEIIYRWQTPGVQQSSNDDGVRL